MRQPQRRKTTRLPFHHLTTPIEPARRKRKQISSRSHHPRWQEARRRHAGRHGARLDQHRRFRGGREEEAVGMRLGAVVLEPVLDGGVGVGVKVAGFDWGMLVFDLVGC